MFEFCSHSEVHQYRIDYSIQDMESMSEAQFACLLLWIFQLICIGQSKFM